MSRPRPTARLTLFAVALCLGASACADDPQARPHPVLSDGSTTTDAPSTTTTARVATSTTAAPTTTAASTPSTKPLTTAPPSQLLTDVTAAYDAAYADLLAAEAIPDENYPALTAHMDAGQAEQWRTVIRRLKEGGQHVVASDKSWRRIEAITPQSSDAVTINVCRFDAEQAVDRSGAVVGEDNRPYRYVETLERREGGWKWSGREWVDSSAQQSDCASQ